MLNLDSNPPPPEKMALIMALSFDRLANQKAFDIFRDNKFRDSVDFQKISKLEQDRIFNELVVSVITLVMLTLESPDLRIDPQFREFFELVRDDMPKAHCTELKNLGIEKKLLKQWEKLIDMRYQEYHQDKLEVRKAAMSMKDYDDGSFESLENIQIMLPVNTIAMGVHRHILRGKTKGKDELFKYLIHEFGRLYVQIRLPLEGKKITFLDKLIIKAKLLFSKR